MVSACLLGLPTSYRASSDNQSDYLLEAADRITMIPFCPEQLGGLPTPRLPSEIEAGDAKRVWRGTGYVRRSDGKDVTNEFKRGAEIALSIARLVKPQMIIMKERSPSCGVNTVYDGTFSNNQIPGPGLTTALLLENGYLVLDEEQARETIPSLMER